MKRREFISLLGGAAVAWPLAARAQQSERVPRIGVLIGRSEGDPEGQEWSGALERGLQELGWIQGKTALIDYRWQTSDLHQRTVFVCAAAHGASAAWRAGAAHWRAHEPRSG